MITNPACSSLHVMHIVVPHVCNGVIHLHDFKLETYRGSYDDFVSGYEQRHKEMNKKYEAYEKQLKAAKRAVNNKQQTKNVKDKAKIAAKKNSKGKVNEGEETFEAPQDELKAKIAG
ncbi:ABC transporter F family member 4 [Tanacetum coccineum]